MHRTFLVALILAVFPAQAGVLAFRNGDRLTGEWDRVQDGVLAFNSEAAGTLNVPLARLKSLSSEKPATLVRKDGTRLNGEITLLESGDWEIETDEGAQKIPAASLQAIYPRQPAPAAQSSDTRMFHGWKGTAAFGYSLLRGDRDGRTLNVAVNGNRKWFDSTGSRERWRTNYFLNILRSSARSSSDVHVASTSLSTGVRQDWLLTASNFAFLLLQFERIEPQNVRRREIYGLGVGRDVLRASFGGLSVLSGATFVRQQILTGAQGQHSESLVGEKLTLRLSRQVNLVHQGNFYPNLNTLGDYRLDANTTVVTKLTPRFTINTTCMNRYLSTPVPGHAKSELIVSTGLGIQF